MPPGVSLPRPEGIVSTISTLVIGVAFVTIAGSVLSVQRVRRGVCRREIAAERRDRNEQRINNYREA
jgi:hypothetical protein